MSLEDTNRAPVPAFERGDKTFTLPPDKVNLLMDNIYFQNDHKNNLYYYVEYLRPEINPKKKGVVIVHWIPISRKDEVGPPPS